MSGTMSLSPVANLSLAATKAAGDDGRPRLVDTTMLYAPRSGGVKRYLLSKKAWLEANRPGVAHAAAGRSGGACDEGGDGFFAVGLDPFCGFFFAGAADFADEDEGVGVRVVVEEFGAVGVGEPVDGVAADADAGGLAEAAAAELPDGFVR